MSTIQIVGIALMAFCAYMLMRSQTESQLRAQSTPTNGGGGPAPPKPVDKPTDVANPDWQQQAHSHLRWLIGMYEAAGLKDGAKSLRDAGRSLYEVPSEPKQ